MGGGLTFGGGMESTGEWGGWGAGHRIFLGGGELIFGWWGGRGTPPIPPSRENPEDGGQHYWGFNELCSGKDCWDE